jgi:hypothetical protein
MNIIRLATTPVAVVSAGALLLPMVGPFTQQAAADEVVMGNVTTLRFFEHDTHQTNVDLGSPGPGPGDQFIFAGDVFDHAGGTKVGHTAGQCTTLTGNATSGDAMCTEAFVLDGGQITIQGLADTGAVFVRSETVPVSITGGTGIYSKARGDGTVRVLPNVPNQTDADFVLNVVTG